MKKRRPSHYDQDLDLRIIFKPVISWLLVFSVIFIGSAVGTAVHDLHQGDLVAKNTRAEEFNALSLEERQLIAEFYPDEIDPETYTMEIVEDTRTMFEKSFTLTNVFQCLAIELGVLSLIVFLIYVGERDCRYALWNLPLDTWRGRLLFLAIFAAWPVLLISALWSLVKYWQACLDERQEVKRLAELEILGEDSEKILAPKVATYSANARATYLKRRIAQQTELNQVRIAALEEKLQEPDLPDIFHKTIEMQIADLRDQKLIEISVTQEFDRILRLPNVAKISAPADPRNDHALMRLILKPRSISIAGDRLDCGDFEVSLYTDVFSCRPLRLGTRKNTLSYLDDSYYLGCNTDLSMYQEWAHTYSKEHISKLLANGQVGYAIIDITRNIEWYYSNELDGYSSDLRRLSTIRATERRLLPPSGAAET